MLKAGDRGRGRGTFRTGDGAGGLVERGEGGKGCKAERWPLIMLRSRKWEMLYIEYECILLYAGCKYRYTNINKQI